MKSKFLRGFAAICVFTVAALAMPVLAENRAMVLPVDPVLLVAETADGPAKFSIEVADDVNERSLGLMFREDLPADRGMLFVFEETRPVGFWMKNTPLPLDLVFIGDDGKVKAIRQGEPLSEAVIAPNDAVRFVLELNAGTAAARRIETGDQMRHPRIDAVNGGFADSPG